MSCNSPPRSLLPTQTAQPSPRGPVGPTWSPLPVCQAICVSVSPFAQSLGRFLACQAAQALASCIWGTAAGGFCPPGCRTEERKRAILSSCVHCSSHCSLQATSSYCPCRFFHCLRVSQMFFFSGCTIYPFVFSATADPLRARSISAVKIIPVKTVKNSAGLVLPPGISPWVGFFFIFIFSLLADHA